MFQNHSFNKISQKFVALIMKTEVSIIHMNYFIFNSRWMRIFSKLTGIYHSQVQGSIFSKFGCNFEHTCSWQNCCNEYCHF